MTDDEFVLFLKARAGDYLRAVSRYDADSYEIVYLRKDLNQSTIRERIDHAHERLTAARGEYEEAEEEFGETYTTVQIREEVVVINIPRGDGRTIGTLVSLEPEAARQLTNFLAECIKREHPSSLPA